MDKKTVRGEVQRWGSILSARGGGGLIRFLPLHRSETALQHLVKFGEDQEAKIHTVILCIFVDKLNLELMFNKVYV